MEKVLTVAKTLYSMYKEMFGNSMDEMKMHKIMYFAQRESIIVNGEFLFSEDFRGWKYGPVLLEIRQQYFEASPFSTISENVSSQSRDLLKAVLDRYGSISSWTLSNLSHAEISWKLSRRGLDPSDNGREIISKEAIKLDAEREKIARQLGTSTT